MLAQFRQLRGKRTPPAINAERTVTLLDERTPLATARVSMKYLPPTRGAGIVQEHFFQLYKAAGRWQIVSTVMHAGQYEGETDERTLDVMGIKPGMTIGEIGAGDGRVTFALARRVGDRGKVYANDIDANALAELTTVRERRGVTNIETIVSRADDPMFPKGAIDLAITAISYHHFTQPVALLKNLIPSLKPGATLVILDPAYDRTGDKDSDRPTTRELVETEAGEAGYELVAMDTSLPRDNIFILRLKTGGPPAAPRVTTTPWTRPPADAEHPAVLAAIDDWWKGHDTDDAELLDRAMVPGTRTWFEEEGALQYIPYSKELERIRSGNRRPQRRPLPGEKRTVVSITQPGNLAAVTMRVEISRQAGGASRSLTTFQLYKADDRWQIVSLAGM
jgi:ubiquinone/menaquinone biosynthesis C-methylase UbiE